MLLILEAEQKKKINSDFGFKIFHSRKIISESIIAKQNRVEFDRETNCLDGFLKYVAW